MPEGNGERGWHADMQRRFEALEKAHRELEDAFIVMTHLETRMSQIVRQHTEWLAAHEELFKRAEKARADMEIKMSEMNDKINFIIDREMRREGGPESR
jgi:hypothetical protein